MNYRFPLIFGKTFHMHKWSLSLGEEIEANMMWKKHPNCILIKVTRKGFNILDMDTNRVILKKHLYAPKMKGKEYMPTGLIKAVFMIPSYIYVKRKPVINQNVS